MSDLDPINQPPWLRFFRRENDFTIPESALPTPPDPEPATLAPAPPAPTPPTTPGNPGTAVRFGLTSTVPVEDTSVENV
jgi:hypothetical protein